MARSRFKWGVLSSISGLSLLVIEGLVIGGVEIGGVEIGGALFSPVQASPAQKNNHKIDTEFLALEKLTENLFDPTSSQQALMRSVQLSGWLDRFRPPRTGQPETTGNGSSRDLGLRCQEDEPDMQPLLPQGRYGWSLSKYPEILVDVSGTSAKQALLVMSGEDGRTYQQAFLPLPGPENSDGSSFDESIAAGFNLDGQRFTAFRLPDDVSGLSLNQTYKWSLSFICGDYFTLHDPRITGWVRRIERSPEIEQRLNTGSPEEQAQWLAENGYWYDLTAHIIESSSQ